MDRRKSLKIIAGTAIAGGAALAGCNPGDDKKAVQAPEPVFNLDRSPDELKNEKEILAKGRFFTDHEMATITVLGDIIIPKDEVSGSASDAKVPAFIEFIVKDMPEHQTPMRGGLRWVDMQCFKRYEKSFVDCTEQQRLGLVDDIAYPEIEYKDDNGKIVKKGKVKPGMEPGVAFFSLMRDLTSTGFYTSQIGVADIGFIGNAPNQWNGVPADVLAQHKLDYN
jgi:gluconate 2-dehydrogenase gamma chain